MAVTAATNPATLSHQSSIKASVSIGAAATGGTEIKGVYEIPDLIPAPETIEVTAIGDDTKQYIPGLKDPGNLEFSIWYDAAVFKALKQIELENTEQYVVIKLVDGTLVEIKGKITLGFSGFGAGDAVSFTMSVAASSVEVKPGGDKVEPAE